MTERASQSPLLPAASQRLLSVVADDDRPVHDICDAVRNDPGLTRRLIGAANALPRSGDRVVPDIDRAVVLLGKRKVLTLALTARLAATFHQDGGMSHCFRRCWTDSLVQAIAAEVLSAACQVRCSGLSFVAGLLQDLGRLELLKRHGEDYVRLMEDSTRREEFLSDLELQAFGTSHAEVSADLLLSYGFPRSIVSAVAAHHDLYRTGDRLQEASVSGALSLAGMTGSYLCQSHKGVARLMLEETLERGPAALPGADQLAALVCQQLNAFCALCNFSPIEAPNAQVAQAEAMQQIARLSLSLDSLASQQSRHVALIRTHSALHRRLFAVMQLLQIDPLTGIPHRQALEAHLEAHWRSGANEEGGLGLLFIDLDGFRRFNESHGEHLGDRVLHHVAQAIRCIVRDKDFPFRYGGDEFAIVIHQPKGPSLRGVAERIRQAIEHELRDIDGRGTTMTASIGVALVPPAKDVLDLARQFVVNAMAAMSRAREEGGNQVVIAGDSNVMFDGLTAWNCDSLASPANLMDGSGEKHLVPGTAHLAAAQL